MSQTPRNYDMNLLIKTRRELSLPVSSGPVSYLHWSHSWKRTKIVIKADPGSSHGHSLQITAKEQVCGKQGGMQLGEEDETEYETVKWRSTLLILLFDLRLGCFLIYTTAQRKWVGTGCVCMCLCSFSHTQSMKRNTQAYLQYADLFFLILFSPLHAHHQSPHIASHSKSLGSFKMQIARKIWTVCNFSPWDSMLLTYLHPLHHHRSWQQTHLQLHHFRDTFTC